MAQQTKTQAEKVLENAEYFFNKEAEDLKNALDKLAANPVAQMHWQAEPIYKSDYMRQRFAYLISFAKGEIGPESMADYTLAQRLDAWLELNTAQITNNLIGGSQRSKSTCEIKNTCSTWERECDQQLLKTFNTLLATLKQ